MGTIIEHVSITYCSRVAAYLRGNNLIVRNCLISDTETEGLYILSSADALLERNIIKRNNMQNMRGYFPSAVKIFNQCYRTVCRDNLVLEQPHSSGIWYDVGNVDGRFFNNWIETATDGFFFEISKGAVAAGNVFVNCEKGIRVLNASDVHLYHNTFINSMASFERTPRSAVADHFGWHPATGPDVDERFGHIFVNNLLIADADYARVLLNVEQTESLCDTLTEPQLDVLDHNVYVWAGEPKSPLIHWSPVDLKEGCNIEYASLAEIQAQEPEFAQNSREWLRQASLPLQSVELRRLNIVPGFPGAEAAGTVPKDVLDALGWAEVESRAPGAFPVMD